MSESFRMETRSNRLRHLPGWLILLLLLALPPAGAEDDDGSRSAGALINEMSRAVRERNYDGTFIYRRSRHIEAMRIIHKSGSGGEHERLISLTGLPREVIRDSRSVTCVFPDNQAVMVEKSRPRQYVAQLPEPIESIAPFYAFTLDGEDRIAGRKAWVVNIRPRDLYRYGYQLWIDQESKLLLKSELKNKSGYPLEQIMFTHLEVLDSVPDALLEPSFSGPDYTWYHNTKAEQRANAEDVGWRVAWIPNGFAMSSHEKQALVASGDPVDHLVFSDGLASVSIFIEKLRDPPQVSVGPARMGGVNAFARYAGGFQVTAVGEVPPATVQRMANSVVAGRRP
jgi:sigma-E factor negative regulatory protein RseB